MIKLFNTISREKEAFKPIRAGRVEMYTCGPTVYDYAHIGNLRTFVFEDVLKRTLEFAGYKVKHIMNITDVDDKTIIGARKENIELKTFTRKYEKLFKEDLKKLNIESPTKFTRATEHIPEMIKMITSLLKNGSAYKTADGIYFAISKFKNYGKLSGLKKSDFLRNTNFHRINADEYDKGAVRDFALWKNAKFGEPAWEAPFGNGRPGWHIECSAMSSEYLGLPFDIHAGGVDLIFPHHENEVAQSEAAAGKKFVKYWIHGEHLLVENRKMSKSLGNIFTIRDLEARDFDPLAFRYLTLTAHYRSQLNFTWESLRAARKSLSDLEIVITTITKMQKEFKRRNLKHKGAEVLKEKKLEFQNAIFNDLNTPKALAVLWNVIRNYHLDTSKFEPKEVIKLIQKFDKVLGLGLNLIKPAKTPKKIEDLLAEREKYRKEKNWRKADEIRQKIADAGYRVEDSPTGPIPHLLH